MPAGGRKRTLAGRYELAEVIGRGGMGTVYRALDLVLGRPVAVKTLPWLIASENPNSVARFEREARAAAALSHPAVVAVYDTGFDASTHFIVMELVAGRSLQTILRDEGPLDPDRAAVIAGGVAGALAAAHRAGIVHRDIKPANVMVADDGAIKVLDFGIARATGASTLTHGSSVIGTASYMAPEQAQGEPADERSDIYALGCVLYALLVGHPPFRGEGMAAVMHQHANVDPRPPRVENPRVPSALSALVMRMLAKSPVDRPRSASEVRDRLAALSEHRARRPAPPAPVLVRAAAPPARRRVIVAGALAAAILAAVIVALTSGQGAPHRVAAVRPGATASKATAPQQGTAARTASTTTARTITPAKATRAVAAQPVAAPAGPAAPAGAPLSPFDAAQALVRLAAADARAGSIDEQARRKLADDLASILSALPTGDAAKAQQQLAAVTQQVAKLEAHGHITSTAVPALNAALAQLSAALGHAATRPASTVAPQAPPGHVGPRGHDGLRHGHHDGLGGQQQGD